MKLLNINFCILFTFISIASLSSQENNDFRFITHIVNLKNQNLKFYLKNEKGVN